MPKIQIALDSLDHAQTLALAEAVAQHVDIFEVGTPCIKHNGIAIVRDLRRLYPDKEILVDLKTMDAGEYEATPFYAAGADICTVLGVAGLATCKGVFKAASAHGKKAQVDLINVEDKPGCARAMVEAGAHIIGIHTGLDAQAAGQTPFRDLGAVAALNLGVELSVAGGIKASTVTDVVRTGAHIIVVGAAIYGAPSPAAAASEIRALAAGW
jgi:3-hexulose-6-phosphate synthase